LLVLIKSAALYPENSQNSACRWFTCNRCYDMFMQMQRLDKLRREVERLYTSNNLEADERLDWGYENHVLFVANLTGKLAKTHGADAELAVAGALLHDIADAVMPRKNSGHEAKSLQMADELLRGNGFSPKESEYVLREILKPHSCKDLMPTTLEGKVMATADGAAHFLTDFYLLFCWRHYGPSRDYQAFKEWVRAKMEKDFNKKLFFDDVKREVLPHYEALKLIFSTAKT
jgi:putative nucleotidyltransferase with HDIG domain